MSKGNHKKRKKPGVKPLPAYKKKFRIVTFASREDIAKDGGKAAFKTAMTKELEKQLQK